MDADLGLHLMRLYQALRLSHDPREKTVLRAKIDALVAEAHADLATHPMNVGEAHPKNKKGKLDA